MQHSSTSTHRTLKVPVIEAKRNLLKGSTSDLSKSSKANLSATPLAKFANKYNNWKNKRMANSSSKATPTKEKISKGSASAMYSNLERRSSSRGMSSNGKPAPERRSSRIQERTVTASTTNNGKQSRAVDYNEAMYDEVVDDFSKMRSTTSFDHTEATSSSTQPSFSNDDGSTIVSEITTDSSYAFHSFKSGNTKFTVDKRYSMVRTIGSGAYGVVISAKDFAKGTNVAIKMVPKAFHDEIDAKRILREIKLLKHFHHDNIIGILDMMPPLARHVEDFKDVYIVTDLMETDLHRIIYSKQSLSIDHVQYFLYQILRAVKYIHSANVLHRDLKPSNLLVNSNCDLKVCDFGLARGISATHDQELEDGRGGSMMLTEYVVTRWYRAPEIMLACHEYSKPIDMWSVGCIFAELLGRKPYLAGDDYIDQVCLSFVYLYVHASQ